MNSHVILDYSLINDNVGRLKAKNVSSSGLNLKGPERTMFISQKTISAFFAGSGFGFPMHFDTPSVFSQAFLSGFSTKKATGFGGRVKSYFWQPEILDSVQEEQEFPA